jgi:hypothetical protein
MLVLGRPLLFQGEGHRWQMVCACVRIVDEVGERGWRRRLAQEVGRADRDWSLAAKVFSADAIRVMSSFTSIVKVTACSLGNARPRGKRAQNPEAAPLASTSDPHHTTRPHHLQSTSSLFYQHPQSPPFFPCRHPSRHPSRTRPPPADLGGSQVLVDRAVTAFHFR